MELESLYQEIIHDHYRNPHHAGLREPFDAQVHHANPDGDDEVTVRVALSDADGEPVLADVSYQALGCAISQASVSVMTDLIIGKTVSEAMAISDAFLNLMQSRGTTGPDWHSADGNRTALPANRTTGSIHIIRANADPNAVHITLAGQKLSQAELDTECTVELSHECGGQLP
ncbi:MAG: Fe-S cluster assembly sulfur transfer protein SufU [Trebonia sp.]|jgi:nitrogen fixation NifU-like protein